MKHRSKVLSSVISLGAAAILIAAFAGCGSGSSSGDVAPNGMQTLRWYGLEGTSTWANTLDPSQVTDSISLNIIELVNANLVKLLPNGHVAPDLAGSWTVSSNHKVYTFTIRLAHFSNGDRVTANDAAWSMERALAPATKSPVAMSYLGHILGAAAYNSGKAKSVAGLKVLSPSKLRITLDEPIAFFLETLTYPTAEVLDPKVVANHPAQSYITNNCAANVGAGPFKFQCRKGSGLSSFFRTGSTHSMTLAPNPQYYGPKPHIKIYMPVIADAQTNYLDYQSGNIDVTAIPSANVKSATSKPGFHEFATSIVDYITPNELSPPFNNVHCRLAVAYAINRDAINKDVLHGTQASTYAVVPRGMLGYYSGANNPHYSPQKAKQELAKCPGGIHGITLDYQHTSVDVDNEYTAVENMLKSVGVGVTIDPMNFNQWLGVVGNSLSKSKAKITENLWIEDYPDPNDYMSLLLEAGQNYDIGGFNNATYNSLVNRAAVNPNPASRAKQYEEAQHIAIGQGAWISIGNANGYALVNPKVHGLVGSEAFGIVVPKDNNWANVSIS